MLDRDGAPAADGNTLSLNSPDGALKMTFTLSRRGCPTYSLSHKGTKVILPSSLGYELRSELKAGKFFRRGVRILKKDKTGPRRFDSGFEIVRSSASSFDETWSPVWGEEHNIRNNYNELLVQLRHQKDGDLMNIRFRLFDDGLGFRYEFPSGQKLTHFVVKEELSEFNCASDNLAWWIPGDYDTQEYEYTTSRLSEVKSHMRKRLSRHDTGSTPFSTKGVQTSLQMKTPEGLYVNIHEAALVNYPCMHLVCNGKRLLSHLTPDAQGWKGHLMTPFNSPWRTVQVAESATAQLSSRMILNLNEPCAYEDVAWIHPVKYMGVWWEMISGYGSWNYTSASSVDLKKFDYASAEPCGRHSANNANVRKYIDFAAANGFDAVLVEGWNTGWEEWAGCNKEDVFDFVTPYPDFDIAALNAYAHSKGIKLIMHHETSASIRNYERHMEEAYSLMNRYGYDAVKSGYVGDILPFGETHYGQWMVNHYLYAVTRAADHHIMVNAHEAIRPTGLCRTYPNLIGNESARGTEYQAFGGTVPEHVTILPFTRLNGGPMDFTPGIFEQELSKWCNSTSHVNATIVNQLALYLTMYSPLQMAADLPEHYAQFPDAFQFIKDVAADWYESRYLDAEPGDYIIVARRPRQETLSGSAKEFSAGRDTWFLGGITDENAREFDIDLDFLGSGKYEAVFYEDAPDADYRTNPQAYTISPRTVSSSDTVHVRMAPGGGVAISFRKI
ncbi:MAG: glycoside hydrolase family 97 protein [Bacteroidales bacterium]|nr:glycoside hydrolase family 97 protein [Bacteroidales bacterium]